MPTAPAPASAPAAVRCTGAGPDSTRRGAAGPVVALVALLAGEVTTVAVLHRLGAVRWLATPAGGSWDRSAWSSWLATTAPEDALATGVRLLALGCAWWLLGSTVLYVAARASRITGAVAAVEWITLPLIRRVADRTVAVALTASTVLGPGGAALAQEQPSPPPLVESIDFPGPLADLAVPSFTLPAATPLPDGWLPPPGAAGTVGETHEVLAAAGETHEVLAGEHLWGIATARLGAARGVPSGALEAREIHAYWVRLIAVNRDDLRSGDPDVVHPGEVLRLPPTM